MTEPHDHSSDAAIETTLQLAAAEGLDAACERIEAAGDAVTVARVYNDLAQALYRRRKDVQQMIEAGRRGAHYALAQAAAADRDDRDRAARLKEIAKTIAFNVAANCWPGWGDDGIEISAEQRGAGLELAELSRRLVAELGLGPRQRGTSHWLVGAHHIAAGDLEAALAALDQAAAAFAEAGNLPSERMARGYRAMAEKLRPDTRAAGEAELERVLQQLADDGSDAARFFRDQIMVADRILCGP